MSKPTNFSKEESLEVIWDVIHEYIKRLNDDHDKYSGRLTKFEAADWHTHIQEMEDNIKTAMAWITEALRDSEIIKLRKAAKELMVQIKEDVPRESVTSHFWDAFDELTELGEKLFHKN